MAPGVVLRELENLIDLQRAEMECARIQSLLNVLPARKSALDDRLAVEASYGKSLMEDSGYVDNRDES